MTAVWLHHIRAAEYRKGNQQNLDIALTPFNKRSSIIMLKNRLMPRVQPARCMQSRAGTLTRQMAWMAQCPAVDPDSLRPLFS